MYFMSHSFERVIHSGKVNGSFYERSLNHWFTRFVQNVDSFRNTAVFLGEAQQFCCGFKGSYVLCKTEQNHIISCLKYNTISISYLLNCCIKSHLHLCISGQKRHSCDIALAARVISLICTVKNDSEF